MSAQLKNIIFDSSDKIVILTGLHDLNPEIARESINQIMKLCANHNCESVLIDVTKTRSFPPTFDLYSFGEELVSTPGIKKLRLAFALSETIYNTYKLFLDVFADRGLHFQFSKDLSEARNWLLSSQSE
jgi:hypothetical protein